ncbi:polyribonucleotide nucleotidyltransferase [Chloroflexota bacterium]
MTLTIETGRLAQQANGSVVVHYGETVVLVTVCFGDEERQADFVPMTVDYEERLYAAGKIPGSFFRREGRPGQEAVLAGRLTDRPVRPLLPKSLRRETQIVVTVLSADQENDPEILGIIGTSVVLNISNIPFEGPLGASRVGYIDGEYVLNPTHTQLNGSLLDLVVVGTRDAVVMVEAAAKEAPEEIILGAIAFGQEANQQVIALEDRVISAHAQRKMELAATKPSAELAAKARSFIEQKLGEGTNWQNRVERDATLGKIKEAFFAQCGNSYPAQEVAQAYDAALKAVVRKNILEKGFRPSGRGLTDIRPISCDVGNLPRTHGSGLFTRGGTQVLTIATLGSLRQEQTIDSISQDESKRFMHHYNFPPFSTGEVKRLGTGRREIGHGALAEKALLPVIPNQDDFPYTIRLVSEVLSSNGSSSMASVCGSTLSLMDAGVPIKAPVAGIAMGLVTENGRVSILTDIEGLEDSLGDMDFKVAGTAAGITALQLDIKTKGIAPDVFPQALAQAKEARLYILERIKETISESRPEVNRYAPRMTKITVDPEKIRYVIGPGGKTIRSITEEAKVSVDVDNNGTVVIGSPSEEATQKAIRMIENLTRDVEVNGIYTGTVSRIMSFGAFVEILPGKEGLVPLSELADYRVSRVEDVVRVGDEVTVMVTEIDRLGRINLSRRAVSQIAVPRPHMPSAQQESQAPHPYPRQEGAAADRKYLRERPQGQGRRSQGGPPHRPPRGDDGPRR